MTITKSPTGERFWLEAGQLFIEGKTPKLTPPHGWSDYALGLLLQSLSFYVSSFREQFREEHVRAMQALYVHVEREVQRRTDAKVVRIRKDAVVDYRKRQSGDDS